MVHREPARMRTAGTCCVFSVLVLCGACSRSPDAGKYAQVSGKITIDGKPLEGATVSFIPAEMKNNAEPSVGMTDASGAYSLSRRRNNDGAWIGENKVAIEKRGPMKYVTSGMKSADPVGTEIPGEPLIPQKYFSPKTSALSFVVKSGTNTNVDFDIKE